MNGPFDYNATPMAPPGIKTLVYENPQQRKTWAQHGVYAWYIGYCTLFFLYKEFSALKLVSQQITLYSTI